MLQALNRCQGRASNAGLMFQRSAAAAVLETPAGLDVLRRLDAATDEEFPHRHEHIEQVALVCLRAKGHL